MKTALGGSRKVTLAGSATWLSPSKSDINLLCSSSPAFYKIHNLYTLLILNDWHCQVNSEQFLKINQNNHTQPHDVGAASISSPFYLLLHSQWTYTKHTPFQLRFLSLEISSLVQRHTVRLSNLRLLPDIRLVDFQWEIVRWEIQGRAQQNLQLQSSRISIVLYDSDSYRKEKGLPGDCRVRGWSLLWLGIIFATSQRYERLRWQSYICCSQRDGVRSQQETDLSHAGGQQKLQSSFQLGPPIITVSYWLLSTLHWEEISTICVQAFFRIWHLDSRYLPLHQCCILSSIRWMQNHGQR